MSAFRLACAGCGAPAPPIEVDPYPFRCRAADTTRDIDHLITDWQADPSVLEQFRELAVDVHIAAAPAGGAR